MESEVEEAVIKIATEEDAKNKSVFEKIDAQINKLGDSIEQVNAKQAVLASDFGDGLKQIDAGLNKLNETVVAFGNNISSGITEKIKNAAKIWAFSFSAKKGFNFIQQTSDQIMRLNSESKKYFGFTLSEYQGIESFFKKSGINNKKYFNQIDRYLRITRQYSLGTKKGLLQLSNAFAKMDAKTRNAYASQYRLSNDFVDFIATNNQKIESALKDNKSWFFTEADVKVAEDFKTALEDIGNEVFGLFKPAAIEGMKATTYFINQISDAVRDLHGLMQNLAGDSSANFEKFPAKTPLDILTGVASARSFFGRHKWMSRLGTFGTMLVVGEDILKGIAGKDSVSKRLYDSIPDLKKASAIALEKASFAILPALPADPHVLTESSKPKIKFPNFVDNIYSSLKEEREIMRTIRNENNFSININADEKTGREIVQELMKEVEIRMPSNLGGAVVQ